MAGRSADRDGVSRDEDDRAPPEFVLKRELDEDTDEELQTRDFRFGPQPIVIDMRGELSSEESSWSEPESELDSGRESVDWSSEDSSVPEDCVVTGDFRDDPFEAFYGMERLFLTRSRRAARRRASVRPETPLVYMENDDHTAVIEFDMGSYSEYVKMSVDFLVEVWSALGGDAEEGGEEEEMCEEAGHVEEREDIRGGLLEEDSSYDGDCDGVEEEGESWARRYWCTVAKGEKRAIKINRKRGGTKHRRSLH